MPRPHTFRVGTNPLDTLGRPLHDLRISVTDRCNFRCVYCMPKEIFGKDYQFLPRAEILTFEEIERLVRIFVSLGVQKIRLTGGEPLVRRDRSEEHTSELQSQFHLVCRLLPEKNKKDRRGPGP